MTPRMCGKTGGTCTGNDDPHRQYSHVCDVWVEPGEKHAHVCGNCGQTFS